jgi:hypothetical protein
MVSCLSTLQRSCLGVAALVSLAGSIGCEREPFQHVQVSGRVTYDDGTVIPVQLMELTFQPQAASLDEKTHPRPGHGAVDVATGRFNNVTTHKPNDGLVAGKHKVKISAYDAAQQISTAIPQEYTDISTTPLQFDTASPVWEIRIRRPTDGPTTAN